MSCKRVVAVLLLAGQICLTVPMAQANPPPDSAAQAVSEFGHRRDAVVRRAILQLKEKWNWKLQPSMWGKESEKPRQKARARVGMANAVLWVLSHPSDFMNDTEDAYYQLQKAAFQAVDPNNLWDPVKYLATWRYWIGDSTDPGVLWKLFDQISYFSESACDDPFTVVGTNCDYDFILVDLAHLIYTYKDGDAVLNDPKLNSTLPDAVPHPHNIPWTYADFLKNPMIYNIICQRQGGNTGVRACKTGRDPIPYAFDQLGDAQVFTQYVCTYNDMICIITAETENHVLNIVTYDYLITNWVMWQGSLTGGRRWTSPLMTNTVSSLWNRLQWRWYNNAEDIYNRTLKVVGRVMHSGMYEANSRPYGRVSLSALLALGNFADPQMGPNNNFSVFPVAPALVKRGAKNAIDYLAIKFAFQSLRGKRAGPMRRSKAYKAHIAFYDHDEFATMMALLTGAFEWNDCVGDGSTDGRPDCLVLGYKGYALVNTLTAMLSTSSGDFRIWPGIHDFMFERGPFYARMKTRYTKDHYPLMGQVPEYFVAGSDTEAFHSGENISSVELHFGDDYILLSAGGTYKKFSPGTFFAKPTMLIPRGDFGHAGEGDDDWEWGECSYNRLTEDGRGPGEALDDVLLSRGKVWDWWESECNIWQYRNFVYGYRFHDRGLTDAETAKEEFSRKHSFSVPEFWESSADTVRSFSIGDGHFEIYEFSTPKRLLPPSVAVPDAYGNGDGYFVVRARFRKYASKLVLHKHREFSRGLLEIVPRSIVPSNIADSDAARWLEDEIVRWNKKSYFNGGDRLESWKYVLTVSKERVHMGSEMGADKWGGEGCDDGILGIYKYDEPSDDWIDAVDMQDQFIPPDISNSGAMKKIPLITVWQLDDHFQPTVPECKLVETTVEGVVVIRQPKGTVCLEQNAFGYCLEWGEGWNCYKLDSRNYKLPGISVDYTTNSCSCFSQ